MNRLKGLTIVFENCEEIFIPESADLFVDVFTNSKLCVRGNITYEIGEYMNIRIVIPNIQLITYHPFNGIENCSAQNRLMRRDITQLLFSYESGENSVVYVPYSDADEYAPIDVENAYEAVTLYGDAMCIDINGMTDRDNGVFNYD